MRYVLHCLIVLTFIPGCALWAEDAAEERQKGIQALKESQTNPRAIVEAARCFAKAAESFANSGDESQATEMNSFLFWCKKKMTYQDIEQFTKGGESAVAAKLFMVEKISPEIDEAQTWFDRAAKFATDNPGEHFLIAVRFFEVASRFVGSKASIAAQERSLKEQALAQETAAAPNPNGVPKAEPNKAVPVESSDPIKKRVSLAKTNYMSELESGRKALLEAFGKREADARKGGNKKVVDQVKEERAAFEAKKTGEQILAFSAENKRKVGVAWKSLSTEYEAAIKEFTKAARDADADAIDKEFKAASEEYSGAAAAPPNAPPSPALAPGALRDKTVVVWLTLANLKQQFVGIIAIDDWQSHVDSLVFGGLSPAKWIAGSESWLRTHQDERKSAVETVAQNVIIQLAITYKDQEITLYRNGQKYLQYRHKSEPQVFNTDPVVLLGARGEKSYADCLAGTIVDARVYADALTDVQIAALRPGAVSPLRPWAWFTFDDGTCRDRMGRFRQGKLNGDASIKNGVLVLNGKGWVECDPIDKKKK